MILIKIAKAVRYFRAIPGLFKIFNETPDAAGV